jgi:hypothetical protein
MGERRPAVDELLPDQRLRADQAAGVAAEVVEGGIVDPQHDHGFARHGAGPAVLVAGDLPRHRDADGLDLADVGARHPHFLALHEEGAVVEDGPHDVPVVAVVAARDQNHRRD